MGSRATTSRVNPYAGMTIFWQMRYTDGSGLEDLYDTPYAKRRRHLAKYFAMCGFDSPMRASSATASNNPTSRLTSSNIAYLFPKNLFCKAHNSLQHDGDFGTILERSVICICFAIPVIFLP